MPLNCRPLDDLHAEDSCKIIGPGAEVVEAYESKFWANKQYRYAAAGTGAGIDQIARSALIGLHASGTNAGTGIDPQDVLEIWL